MTKVVNMDQRGTLTLPKELRKRLGLKDGGEVVVQETPEGLLLRPSVAPPVEIYSAKRVAEFQKSNDEALAGYRFKK